MLDGTEFGLTSDAGTTNKIPILATGTLVKYPYVKVGISIIVPLLRLLYLRAQVDESLPYN